MDEMEDSSMFYDVWLRALDSDDGTPPFDNAGQRQQVVSEEQTSSRQFEYLDPSKDFLLHGAELNDTVMPHQSELKPDESLRIPVGLPMLLDQTSSADPAAFSINQYENASSHREYTSGIDMELFNDRFYGQSHDLSTQDREVFPTIGSQHTTDAMQASHRAFIDFNAQEPSLSGTGFFQLPLPGPTAPLSPALTPPIITSSRSLLISSGILQTDDQRWQATLDRSHAADKSFLYGVLTTKIYCRPSCPSRRPTRKHAIFYLFPGAIVAAQNDGLRPCKRCKPETQDTVDTGVLGIVKVMRLVIADASSPFSAQQPDTKLESLAEAGGLSAFHFHRSFKATTQITPGDFITACRSLALGDALGMDAGEPPAPRDITTLINISAKWKPRTARKALGAISPTNYAGGATNLAIERITIETVRGPLCIAYTSDGGILAVLLGLDAQDRICMRFPNATGSEAYAEEMGRCVRELQEAGADREGEIPPDVQPVFWRARLWVKLVRDSVLGWRAWGQDVTW